MIVYYIFDIVKESFVKLIFGIVRDRSNYLVIEEVEMNSEDKMNSNNVKIFFFVNCLEKDVILKNFIFM